MNKDVIWIAVAALTFVDAVCQAEQTAMFDQPYLDRWMYGANATPGTRGMASVFADPEDWSRLGQFMLGFDLAEKIPTGRGQGSYEITSIKVTLVTSGQPGFTYDSTYDRVSSYLGADGDAGRPIEMHGVGYADDYTGEDFLNRRTPINGPNGRTAYPLSWDGNDTAIDASRNVAGGFESSPWAIGRVIGGSEGQLVSDERNVEFALVLTDERILEYLQASLDVGKLYLMVSSLQPALQQGGTFVNFFTSDSQEEFFFGGYSPRLEIQYAINDLPQVAAPEIKSIKMNDGQLTMSWQQHEGFRYFLESSSDCRTWTAIEEFLATEGGLFSHELQVSQQHRFYRLRRRSE